MAKFHVPFFEGLQPKTDNQLIKDSQASVSVNARLDRGSLSTWRDRGNAVALEGAEIAQMTSADYLASIKHFEFYGVVAGGARHYSSDQLQLQANPDQSGDFQTDYYSVIDIPSVSADHLLAHLEKYAESTATTQIDLLRFHSHNDESGSYGGGDVRMWEVFDTPIPILFTATRNEEAEPNPSSQSYETTAIWYSNIIGYTHGETGVLAKFAITQLSGFTKSSVDNAPLGSDDEYKSKKFLVLGNEAPVIDPDVYEGHHTLFRRDNTENWGIKVGNRDIVKTPVIADGFERIYYTDSGANVKYSWKSIPTPEFDLGVPPPGYIENALSPLSKLTTSRTVELTQVEIDAAEENKSQRAYAFAFVVRVGGVEYEGPLSRISNTVYLESDGDPVQLNFAFHALTGTVGTDIEDEWALNPDSTRRIYRVSDDVTSLHRLFSSFPSASNPWGEEERDDSGAFWGAINIPIDPMRTDGSHAFCTVGDALTFKYNGVPYMCTLNKGTDTVDGLIAVLNSAKEAELVSGKYEFKEGGNRLGPGLVTPSLKDTTVTLDDGTEISCKRLRIDGTAGNDVYSLSLRNVSQFYRIADVPISQLTYSDTTLSSAIQLGIDDSTTDALPWSTLTQYIHTEPTWLVNGKRAPQPAGPPSVPSIYTILTTELGTTEEERAYVFTYVTALGEEGPPGTPTPSMTVGSGEVVKIEFEPDNVGNFNIGSDSFRRVYRTATGTTSSSFQYVMDVPFGDMECIDNKSLSELGEVLPSLNFDPPPFDKTPQLDPLQGISKVTNGFLAGFTKNVLCFSEQFMPHAWPPEYRLSFTDDIVGLGVTGNSVIVMTTAFPYLVTGAHPSAMSAVRMETAQACVSSRSIVDVGDHVIYASPDGLVGVGESGAQLLTKDLLTRDQWQAYDPESILGLYYEGFYLGFSSIRSFMIDKEGVFSDMELGDGSVFPSVDSVGNTLFEWFGEASIDRDQDMQAALDAPNTAGWSEISGGTSDWPTGMKEYLLKHLDWDHPELKWVLHPDGRTILWDRPMTTRGTLAVDSTDDENSVKILTEGFTAEDLYYFPFTYGTWYLDGHRVWNVEDFTSDTEDNYRKYSFSSPHGLTKTAGETVVFLRDDAPASDAGDMTYVDESVRSVVRLIQWVVMEENGHNLSHHFDPLLPHLRSEIHKVVAPNHVLSSTNEGIGRFQPLSGFTDYEEDSLYLLDGTGYVTEFNTGLKLDLEWTSKEFLSTIPINMGVVKTVATLAAGETASVSVYANDVLLKTHTILNGAQVMRLPAGAMCARFKFTLEGTGTIHSVTLAPSVAELRGE
jgi:hypothetical protein